MLWLIMYQGQDNCTFQLSASKNSTKLKEKKRLIYLEKQPQASKSKSDMPITLQIYTAGIGTHLKSVKVTSICHRYYHVKV